MMRKAYDYKSFILRKSSTRNPKMIKNGENPQDSLHLVLLAVRGSNAHAGHKCLEIGLFPVNCVHLPVR